MSVFWFFTLHPPASLSSHGVRSSTLPSNRSASASLLEENVLPNNTNINNNNAVASTPAATRKSSRLESKQKEHASHQIFTRSRANSKKRSASPSSRLGTTSDLDPSPTKIPSMSNFSTYTSSSTSTRLSSSSVSTESFSSLAKQQHGGQGWGKNSHHHPHHRRHDHPQPVQ